jgi:hypothetical protein
MARGHSTDFVTDGRMLFGWARVHAGDGESELASSKSAGNAGGKRKPLVRVDKGRRDAMFGFYSGPYLPGPRSTRGLATLTLISFPARE